MFDGGGPGKGFGVEKGDEENGLEFGLKGVVFVAEVGAEAFVPIPIPRPEEG